MTEKQSRVYKYVWCSSWILSIRKRSRAIPCEKLYIRRSSNILKLLLGYFFAQQYTLQGFFDPYVVLVFPLGVA
jgi:hypothetical protein